MIGAFLRNYERFADVKIGIIGAENSHTIGIAKVVNIDKAIDDLTVDYVWGETASLAQDAADKGRIPNIVEKPEDMLGKVDGVVVDHRHPKYHLDAVEPFCYRSEKGKIFLELARKKSAPVTSYSPFTVCESFSRFKSQAAAIGKFRAACTSGPCELDSKYGGIFFYGIHQVELVLNAFGFDAESVVITRNRDEAAAILNYPDGRRVCMNFLSDPYAEFQIYAIGSESKVCMNIDKDYSASIEVVRIFTKMFRSRIEPIEHEKLLKPVQVLETLEKSLQSGRIEEVI